MVAHVYTGTAAEPAAEPAEAYYISGSTGTERIVALFAGLGRNQPGIVVRRSVTLARVAAALAYIYKPQSLDFVLLRLSEVPMQVVSSKISVVV